MAAPVHALNWFEIPVTDFGRARAFYEPVLDRPIESLDVGPTTMGFLSADPNGLGGALVPGDGNSPSGHGGLIYLNVGADLSPALARVEAPGG